MLQQSVPTMRSVVILAGVARMRWPFYSKSGALSLMGLRFRPAIGSPPILGNQEKSSFAQDLLNIDRNIPFCTFVRSDSQG